jgi:peptidoglycan/xylan/chitin deacetylase (PgdA/CDA1 family)
MAWKKKHNIKNDANYLDPEVRDLKVKQTETAEQLAERTQQLDDRIDNIITSPAEGISQQEIIDSREQKSSLGANVRDIRSRTNTGLKNETFNGDFTQGQGLLGWDTYSGTVLSTSSGKMIQTGNGGNRQVRARQSDGYGLSEMPYYEGHKLYVKGKFKVTNPDSTGVGFDIYGRTTPGNIVTLIRNTPQQNVEYTVSDVVTITGGSGNMLIQVKTFYPSESVANGKSTEVSNIVVIDLTKTFGAGNEPSKEEMDYLLSRYPERFFNGVADAGRLSDGILGLLKTKVEPDMNIVNSVINGDFKNNIRDPWLFLSGTTGSVADNTLQVVGTGGNSLVRAYQTTNIPYKLGDKIYVRGEFEVDNNDCKMAGIYLTTETAATNETLFRKTAPKPNESFVMSGIMDNKDPNGSGYVRLYLRADYADSATANGKKLKARKVMAINLTQAFGKGNEPTDREKIDAIIKAYPNGFFETKPKLTQWQMAISSQSLQFTREKKALLALTIDDGNTTDYTTAWPLYKERGLKGTSWLIGKNMNTNDSRWLNTQMITEMYEDGWDFQCHTYNHPHMNELATETEIRAEFEQTNTVFDGLGLPKPKHHAYPYGKWTQQVIDIGLEYRDSLRATGDTSGIDYNEWDRPQYGALNSRSIDISDDNVGKIDEIKKVIDETIRVKGALILYHHQVLNSPGQYEAKTEHIATVLDYIKSKVNTGLIESVTISEMVSKLKDYNA